MPSTRTRCVTLLSLAAPFAAALSLSAGSASAQQVDETLLNVREFGGVTDSVFVSSRIFDQDDPTEAVGNPAGPVEPGTFIFADNGNGGEESMTLNSTSIVTLLGLRITGGGAGAGAGDPRTIGLVEVFGSFGQRPSVLLGSDPDFNDAAGFEDILFAGPTPVDQIIIRFLTPEQGSRVTEIDAIVPEPGSLAAAALGAAGLLLGRRRFRR